MTKDPGLNPASIEIGRPGKAHTFILSFAYLRLNEWVRDFSFSRGAFLVSYFPDFSWPNSCRLRKWKKLIDFPRLTLSVTCIGKIRALWPNRWIPTILVCKWAIYKISSLFSVIKRGPGSFFACTTTLSSWYKDRHVIFADRLQFQEISLSREAYVHHGDSNAYSNPLLLHSWTITATRPHLVYIVCTLQHMIFNHLCLLCQSLTRCV